MMMYCYIVFFFFNILDVIMLCYVFCLFNVFVEFMFGGNQFVVFEDGWGLDDVIMQVIGCQFNLFEIMFIFFDDMDGVMVCFCIFMFDYEMLFVGYLLLGIV